MKKYAIILMIIISLLTNINIASAQTFSLTVYVIGVEEFQEFIKNPYKDILEEQCEEIRTFNVSEEDPEHTTVNIYKDGQENTYYGYRNEGRIANLIVTEKFAKYLCNAENIEDLLSENGIKEQLYTYALIEVGASAAFNVHPIVWIKTEYNDYFAEIIADMGDQYNNRYLISSQQEFSDKFLYKNGRLKIDNQDISSDYIKFSNTGVYLPFRTIMESLKSEIIWSEENYSIIIKDLDKEYILKLKEFPTVYRIDNDMEVGPILYSEWFNFCYKNINGTIVMDNITIRGFLKLIGADIDVDYGDSTVYIYHK